MYKGQRHDKLIYKASEWLRNIGKTNIIFDYKTPSSRYVNSHYRLDVVGFSITATGLTGLDTRKMVAIECGGIDERKMSDLNGKFLLLFHWPYGSDRPHIYKKGSQGCDRCH